MNIIQKVTDRKVTLHKVRETLTNPTFTVPSLMVIFFVGKFLGFVKIRVIAQLFGATAEADLFWAAFTIPDLFFNIIVAGSINAAIIPVFTKVLLNKGDRDLTALFIRINALFTGLFLIFSVVVFILSDQIAAGMVGGGVLAQVLNVSSAFQPQDALKLAELMRIMMISPILLGFSSILSGYLQVYKRFVVTAMAPLLYNVGFIVGSMLLVKSAGLGIEGLSYAVILGSFLHFAVQIPVFMQLSGKFLSDIRSLFSFSQARELGSIIKLSVPRILGAVGEQVNVIVNTLVSFTIVPGALSAYRYAFSLFLFPPQIISGAISMTAMSKLSALFSSR